ncbi:putative transporter small subunit [Stutzerimonas stutzeri]|nr:putative transporter small subunit [Stutzerimonas stutzeri]MCQ4240515.1 putative transporter small subunit [Stutzerimonas stutzeri]
MSSIALTAYVLIWPALAALVFALLCTGLVNDIREARRNGTDLV